MKRKSYHVRAAAVRLARRRKPLHRCGVSKAARERYYRRLWFPQPYMPHHYISIKSAL